MSSKARAEEIKQEGNEALKTGDYATAEALYTKAAALDKKNHTIFSNRSKARLTLRDHHGAAADAEMAIKLNPTWAKGFFRAAEVYATTENWTFAVQRYETAALMERAAGNDATVIEEKLAHAREQLASQNYVTKRAVPASAAVGVVLGLALVTVDAQKPNPFMQSWLWVILTLIVAGGMGAGFGQLYLVFGELRRQSELMEFKKTSNAGRSSASTTPGPTGMAGAAASGGPESAKPQRATRRKVDKKPPWAKGAKKEPNAKSP